MQMLVEMDQTITVVEMQQIIITAEEELMLHITTDQEVLQLEVLLTQEVINQL
jgi:hypothetical protein